MPNYHLHHGKRYRIRYKENGQRNPREIVATFLEEDAATLVFSGRPAFGTASINTRFTEIISITEAGNAEPHSPRAVKVNG